MLSSLDTEKLEFLDLGKWENVQLQLLSIFIYNHVMNFPAACFTPKFLLALHHCFMYSKGERYFFPAVVITDYSIDVKILTGKGSCCVTHKFCIKRVMTVWVNGKIQKNCEGKVSFSVSNINSPAMISILAATYVAKDMSYFTHILLKQIY